MSLYTPAHFTTRDRAAMARVMHDYPFATLITVVGGEPQVSHLPFLHVADREPHGSLLGHMARANLHWQHLTHGESVAIFQGPHAYISPSWYVDPQANVPTWNYAVVHAHGPVELIDDEVEARAVLDALVHRFESDLPAPWAFRQEQSRRDALVRAIVAFRVPIKHIDAKFKLGQNRSATDRVKAASALRDSGYPAAQDLASWMESYGSVG